ncbi:DUF742 domain-containing protein [Umezawaea endophytica]|uniref:DUF742 domain-containing protein n=1 Tax=Umezawaea endophytica TaxID=1654476 RepID=A0A9X2VUA5_9PSEU|nr:DUF742 domain-containing protein [Umezawaea endophytica]MCS7482943.1 DUF742 domain-containing protein [Umezawaea endophytica]
MTPGRGGRALVRSHVVTGGRATPSRNTLDHITLITATKDDVAGLEPEKRRLVRLCRGGWLSVAEAASHLDLPISVTKVLLADLVDSGHITATAPAAPAGVPPRQLLKDVLDGLRALL